MKILYFAWLRERLNKDGEDVAFPPEVKTVGEAIDWLATHDEAAEIAFAKRGLIRAALDATIVEHDAKLGTATTLALFPPMTGGGEQCVCA